MQITFSIITVTLNCKEALLKTISSVQSQKYKNFSHIVKDGLSIDGTNKINFAQYSNTNFYEFGDKGVYDAMNQGFLLAKNKFIIFLNAGDIFYSEKSLSKLVNSIKNNPNHQLYAGGTLQIDPSKRVSRRLIGMGALYKILPLSQLPHPSIVIRRNVLEKLEYKQKI